MNPETIPRFGGHAPRYHRYRPGYPSIVYDRIGELAGQPHHHAIDLGAGTGQATAELLRRFDRVTAIEPDADMARFIAPAVGLDVLQARAELADLPAASADVVVAATSFHWMDKAVVSRLVARWLRPNGVFATFAYNVATWRPKPVQDIVHAHYSKWRSVMHERLSCFEPYEDALNNSGAFAKVEAFDLAHEQEMTAATTAGFLMTTSYGSRFARESGDESGYLLRFTEEIARAAGQARIIGRFPITGAYAFAH